MITPLSDYRPNPDRAVYVQGVIDQQMVNRLTPEIISLQNRSRDPITIYIDSLGGSVRQLDIILKLLNASNQDFANPCRLITVVTSMAASAAADLLSSGDYALAYPQSTIWYHGLRLKEDEPLTAETTSLLAQHLRANNESYAMELARQVESRFMWRFINCRKEFDGLRHERANIHLTDLECFLAILNKELSESAQQVLRNAEQRHGRYSKLLRSVLAVVKKHSKTLGSKTPAQMEALQIKAIVDFELKSNKKNPDWRFETEGIHSLTDDFFLLNEYLYNIHTPRFIKMCARYSKFLLKHEEIGEIDALPEEEQPKRASEKVIPILRPIWSFFVAFCHALQRGENILTASDAYWLGLIDEVIGEQDLRAMRMVLEFEPDEQPSLEAPPAMQT